MKRFLSCLFIAAYSGVILFGVACHTFNYATASHTAMYFIVWDMFCGWTAYDSRLHVVAQGESGEYYEAAPAPWGVVRPFGSMARRHYDVGAVHVPTMAMNVLRHTRHEPITRAFVVEECWAKKYNLPEELWNQQFDEPKDAVSYYQVRRVMSPEGHLLQTAPPWMSRQLSIALADNPRIKAAAGRSRPFYTFDVGARNRTPDYAPNKTSPQSVGAPLAE